MRKVSRRRARQIVSGAEIAQPHIQISAGVRPEDGMGVVRLHIDHQGVSLDADFKTSDARAVGEALIGAADTVPLEHQS